MVFKSRFISLRNCSSMLSKCIKSSLDRGPPWKILFFGTDTFSMHSLKALCAKLRTGTLIESLGIVTKAGSIVDKFGRDESLPSYIWPVEAAVIRNKYDVGFVVSFGKLISNDVIQSFPLGCINVHASILPRWRGAAPIVHAIMNGDTETGITIMRIHPYKFDVGEIIRQYRIPITPDETCTELEKRLAKCGSNLLMECLRDLPRCLEMATPQPEIDITYAPKIRPELSAINWEKMTARNILNLHRALNHIYPLTTNWHGTRVKLTEVLMSEEDNRKKASESESQMVSKEVYKSALEFLNASKEKRVTEDTMFITRDNSFVNKAGTIQFFKNKRELLVSCCDGKNIIVKKLKLSGKSVSALDFYNGYLAKKPKSEWKFGI